MEFSVHSIDPALISPDRLDHLINIRMLGISQRQEEFLILLHSKSFYLRNKKYCLNEFGYKTMGYNARDLAALFNEILLISITRNKPIIDTDTFPPQHQKSQTPPYVKWLE
jgi:ATP-dependent 26S proteasome regulatory subunit